MSSANNISDARAAIAGAVNVAPAGTTLPTDASTALANTFKPFYSTADGAVLKCNHNIQTFDAWEAADIVNFNDSNEVELTINPMECAGLNATVCDLIFGSANVTKSAGGDVTGYCIKDDLPEEVVIVIETILRDGTKQRIIIPRWQCTTMGDLTFKRGALNVPALTGKCLVDPATGKKVDVKLADPV